MDYSFQKTYTLLPQSPLIHFQWKQPGAALRATEVKPKLDRYIIKRYGEPIPDNWRNEQSPNALNYKLRLVADGSPEFSLLGYIGRRNADTPEKQEYVNIGCPYDIYYGNMGTNDEKRGVTVKIRMTVDCFLPELLKYIDDIIGDFFIVKNFGTMQGKGFGSYIVDGKPNDSNYICQTLTTEYQANACYRFKASRAPFKQIKCIYSLMKTGLNQSYLRPPVYRRSILFDYMHDNNIGNEKAWLKQSKIAPALGRNTSGKEIERLSSPVLFKVINSVVYFVGMPVNEEIYGKTFLFSSSMGSGEISVPCKDELPDNFMNEFMRYAFTELTKCHTQFRDIQYIRLEEVKRNG